MKYWLTRILPIIIGINLLPPVLGSFFRHHHGSTILFILGILFLGLTVLAGLWFFKFRKIVFEQKIRASVAYNRARIEKEQEFFKTTMAPVEAAWAAGKSITEAAGGTLSPHEAAKFEDDILHSDAIAWPSGNTYKCSDRSLLAKCPD